jgi:hypothetical protein
MNAQKIILETSIVKQTTINRLPLPDLALAQIKDYLFYDPYASKQIQDTRKHKSNILDKIENAYTREKHTQFIRDEYYNDSSKHSRYNRYYSDSLKEYLDKCNWISCAFIFKCHGSYKYDGMVVHSYFCSVCGNYRFIRSGNDYLPNRCICMCMNNGN